MIQPHVWLKMALLVALAISVSDCMWRRVSNELVVSCLAVAFGLQLSCGGMTAMGDGLMASILGGGLMVVAYARGMVGAADAKVTFAYAAMVGMQGLVLLMVVGALSLGLMAVAAILADDRTKWHHILMSLCHPPQGQALTMARKSGQTLPATVALSLGLAVALINQGS